MSSERKIAHRDTASAVEGLHWAPPQAALEMPRQVLEAEEPRRPRLMARLRLLLSPPAPQRG